MDYPPDPDRSASPTAVASPDSAPSEVPKPDSATEPMLLWCADCKERVPAVERGACLACPLCERRIEGWCERCNKKVLTQRNGQCVGCGRPLKGAAMFTKNPINRQRRKMLRDKHAAYFEPATPTEERMCELLASVDERLDAGKPGTVEFGRLVELRLKIDGELEARRDARRKADDARLESMSKAELVAHLEQTLADLKREGESMPTVERRGNLEQLAQSVERVEPAAEAEPPCRFCYRTVAACDALKESNLDAWRTLHFLDSEEVTRRSDALNAEMRASLKRGTEPQW